LTYALCSTRSLIVAQAIDTAWVAHEDGRCDLLLGGGRDRDGFIGDSGVMVTTSAVCVVENLATLIDNEHRLGEQHNKGQKAPT
jgi:hypothetical protein